MQTYSVRVRLPNGTFFTVQVQAVSPGMARSQVEAQYGAGSFMGLL